MAKYPWHSDLFRDPPPCVAEGNVSALDLMKMFPQYKEAITRYIRYDTFDENVAETASWVMLLKQVREDTKAPWDIVRYVCHQRYRRWLAEQGEDDDKG